LKTIYSIIIFIIILTLSFLSGFYYCEYTIPDVPPEIKIIKEYKTIYSKPPEISYRDCYLSDIKIQHEIIDYSAFHTDIKINASDLCKSKNQDIRIEVNQSGNIKFYVGAVVIGAGVAWIFLR